MKKIKKAKKVKQRDFASPFLMANQFGGLIFIGFCLIIWFVAEC